MKKILFLLAMLPMFIFTACSSDDDNETTYTFNYQLEDNSLVKTECILFEYNSNGEKVVNHSIDCYYGLSETITANENSEKVKVYVKMNSSNKWVQQVFYLNKGGNIDITVTGETIIGTKEP